VIDAETQSGGAAAATEPVGVMAHRWSHRHLLDTSDLLPADIDLVMSTAETMAEAGARRRRADPVPVSDKHLTLPTTERG
jgi:hypothetical protein